MDAQAGVDLARGMGLVERVKVDAVHAVVEQIKARVAAKVDAKRCQKGAIPDAETTCLMAAINKGEIDACRKK